ncbi:MAG: signal recognition particle receptor subunit alpha, partial [Candidatus Woesearchaeota archaeon]
MVFDSLQDSLRNSFKKLSNALFVDDTLINELVKDLQRSLLQADVHVKLVFSLGQAIKTRIKEEKTPQGLSKKEHLTHIVYEELANFLGAQAPSMKKKKKPLTIMLVGLFG